MDLIGFCVHLQAAQQEGADSPVARFAVDYLQGRFSVAYPGSTDIVSLVGVDWEIYACLIFLPITKDRPATHLAVLTDTAPTPILPLVQRRFLDHRERMTAPESGVIADIGQCQTRGGLLIGRHNGYWDMVGLYPNTTSVGMGLRIQEACFRHDFPQAIPEYSELSGLLDQAHQRAAGDTPTRGKPTNQTTILQPGNVFGRLWATLDRYELPRSEHAVLHSALKVLRDGRLKVVCRTPHAPDPEQLTPNYVISNLFVTVGWKKESTWWSESEYFQEEVVIPLRLWVSYLNGLSEMWEEITQGLNLFQAEERKLVDGVYTAWVVVTPENADDPMHQYLMVHPRVNLAEALSEFIDEFGDRWDLDLC